MNRFLAATVLVALGLPALAEEADPPRGSLRVWEGYLYRDREKRLQIGWPVVAMGVMAQPDHLVGEPLAGHLDPLVSKMRDSHVFWNYRLEDADDARALAAVPRILVRLRGRVTGGAAEDPFAAAPRVLEDAELLSVEFVGRAWLLAWAGVFRDERSPFRIDLDREPLKDRDRRIFAPKALSILEALRAAPGATKEQIETVRAIAPGAKVVARFRRRIERDLQRWLVQTCRKHEVELAGLEKLPPLPPSSTEIQKWFLECEDRTALLARVGKAWSGGLEELSLVHYVKDGNRTSYTVTALDEVARWDDATYRRHRRTTRGTLDR